MRFGDFVAVDHVSFRIRRGEIFGFLGSNGCGKSTTMKMLTGLLPASEGQAWLFGQPVDPRDIDTRRRVGYMTQAFSLYGELTVHQNLVLHARLFGVPEADIPARVRMLQRFDLQAAQHSLPAALPLGMRQRLSLAVAMVHKPELLILDEPTSGVDPVARDGFWRLLVELSRRDRVTIFISTHFMNEAERCDRMSMMHAGKVLDSDTPARLVAKRGAATLEEAFIGYLVEAGGGEAPAAEEPAAPAAPAAVETHTARRRHFSAQRMLSYVWREALELQRDPVRATLALVGSLILMFVMGYGISLDVEDLRFAVLDRDQTTISRSYAMSLSGSRYFIEQPPLTDYDALDRRMRSGELTLAIEIPGLCARCAARRLRAGGRLVRRRHAHARRDRARLPAGHPPALADRAGARAPGRGAGRPHRHPDALSLQPRRAQPAGHGAGRHALLLLLLPAMLTALAVVREKESGSITNLYVTPVTRTEFLLGKQLPYVVLAMLNFLLMCLMAVTLFGVPVTGSFATLALAALIFSGASTGFGLLASTLTRSQIASMFLVLIGTLIPTTQFAGLVDPVSSLEGVGRAIGEVYPASHMIAISRGVFSKALGFRELAGSFGPLLLSVPAILGLAIALTRKQEN